MDSSTTTPMPNFSRLAIALILGLPLGMACASRQQSGAPDTRVAVDADPIGATDNAARSAAAARATELSLADGSRIRGLVSADRIRIEEGAVVTVEDDCRLVASESIVIDGRLVVDDVQRIDPKDAPRLELNAGVRLTVNGCVIGGKGRSLDEFLVSEGLGLDGGNGSDIYLSAPDSLVRGLVIAGAGGQGGSGGDGGRGGSVHRVGRQITDLHPEPSLPRTGGSVVGGDGGSGGAGVETHPGGGDGGEGGSVTSEAHPGDFDRNAPAR